MEESAPAKFELGDVSSLIGIIGASAICLALSHQLGFFVVVDLKLLSLMTIQDILSNSLSYVPITFFFIAFVMWVQLAGGELPGFKHIGDLMGSSAPKWAIATHSIIIIFSILFLSSWPLVAMIALTFLYGALLSWLATKETSYPKWMFIALIYAMFLMAIAFFLGASHGIAGLSTTRLDYELEFTSGKVIQVNLLKTTSDVFIVRQDLKTVSAISRGEIASLRRLHISPHEAPISLLAFWRWLEQLSQSRRP